MDRLKDLRAAGETLAVAADGKYDSPGMLIYHVIFYYKNTLFRVECKILHIYSTSIINKEDHWHLGCRKINGIHSDFHSLSSLLITNNVKVTSSSKMEPLAAKTLLVNLATEHKLVMDSVTTDRSSDLRTVMR